MVLTQVTLDEIQDVKKQFDGSPLAFLLDILSGGTELESPRQGYFVGPLNSNLLLESIEAESYPAIQGIGTWATSYYVDDSPEDFIRKYHDILESDERIFAVFFTRIDRHPGESGGWRWHKWGEYLGVHTPVAEYLDDEPEIDHVYVVHISHLSY